MSTGILSPYSMQPMTNDLSFGTKLGTNIRESMMGYAASLASDADWMLAFNMPATSLPAGQLKALLAMRTTDNTIAHGAKIELAWNVTATTVEALTLNAESIVTINPAATAQDTVLTKVTLSASTPLADRTLYMRVRAKSTGNISAIFGISCGLLWE